MASGLRFLWLTKYDPLDPDTGAANYSNGLIRSLVAAGATGTLLAHSHGAPATPPEGLRVVLTPPPTIHRGFSLLSPLQSDAFTLSRSGMADGLRGELRTGGYDVVVIDYFAMGWALDTIRALKRQGVKTPPIIYASHNHEITVRKGVAGKATNLLLRQVMKLDAFKATRMEHDLMREAALIVANTQDDADLYAADGAKQPILVLTPAYDGAIVEPKPITEGTPKRVILLGAFEWIAKQMTLRHFLDAAEGPFNAKGIELLIVGKMSAASRAEVAQRWPYCTTTGRVPDVKDYLKDARIGVMPDDVGGGFKHKILYYAMNGLPIATISSQAAGFPLDPDKDMLGAETIEGLVDAICDSIDDLPRLNGMKDRAFAACRDQFGWAERGQKLYDAARRLAGSA